MDSQENLLSTQMLLIPSQLLKTLPTIDGKYFFTKPFSPLDDHVFKESLNFAVNPYQQYQAPKLDHPWPYGSEIRQDFDANLAKIQERQAYTTKPLDTLATWTFANVMDPETRRALVHFIHLTRSQLAMTARQIQEMRLDNYADAIGAKPNLASENRTSSFSHAVVTKTTPASEPKASRSVQGSFHSSPSRITESINPLHIPEIRSEIGRFLNKSALARCASVCRDWNQTFHPLLYSVVEITRRPTTTPSIETLRRNETFIKSMSVATERLHPLQSHLLLPNLKTLKLHLNCSCNTPEPMIRNNRSIRFLELSRIYTDDRNMFWKSVSSLPHLEELTIQNQHVCMTNALWDICSRLKKLNLVSVRLEGFQTPTGTGTSLERTFHLLRDLKISKCEFHGTGQAMLVMKCQNLERLEWKVDWYSIRAAEITTLVQDFTQNLASGKWPNIKSLAIGFHSVQDTTFAELTRAIDNRTLEELDVSNTQFGECAFNALKHHFSTLRVLNIRNCPNLTSGNVLELLVSCPSLQSLTVDRIYARYLDPNQEWSCRMTLQSLSIEFELDREPNPDEPSATTAMEATPQELNAVVFTCLGQLRELKHLTVGYHEPGQSRQAYVRASIPLEIQLSKGLREMAGLKRLNHFSMGVLTSSLGPKEVDWMIDNWPNLDILEGLSKTTTKIPRQRVAKRKGITVK